jgi:hypothetical protein
MTEPLYLGTLEHTGLTIPVDTLPCWPAKAGEQILYTGVNSQLIPIPVLIEAHELAGRLADELEVSPPYRIRWFAPKDEAPHDWSWRGALARAGLMVEGDFGDLLGSAAPRDGTVEAGFATPAPDDGLGPTIDLLWTLRGDLLRMVIAHEMRHLAQPHTMTREEREADAERFGMAHVA